MIARGCVASTVTQQVLHRVSVTTLVDIRWKAENSVLYVSGKMSWQLFAYCFVFLFFYPVSTQRPNSLQVHAAGEPGLWTSQGDAEVKLRMGDSGLAAETPLTVNQMFTSAVERFGDHTALSWKEGEQQKSLNYKEYYQTCRTAAKSFLKVTIEESNINHSLIWEGHTIIWTVFIFLFSLQSSLGEY